MNPLSKKLKNCLIEKKADKYANIISQIISALLITFTFYFFINFQIVNSKSLIMFFISVYLILFGVGATINTIIWRFLKTRGDKILNKEEEQLLIATEEAIKQNRVKEIGKDCKVILKR